MIDFPSVTTQGAFNYSRARVLWSDGELRVFTPDGMVRQRWTREPVRLKGYLRAWLVESPTGSLVMKGRCMTCGGPAWWRLMRKPMEELWETPFVDN